MPGFEPEPGKPYIFMMNHQSMFDIVAAFVLIKINLRFIAKRILKSVPFLGWYMSVTGMVFIDRKGSVVSIAADTEPFSERTIPSGGPAWAVVELNAGAAAKMGLAAGDKVRHPEFDGK